ncbi:MAG TPA: hypothetical protein VF013_07250 [Candidatus Limnocylindria bacterium]
MRAFSRWARLSFRLQRWEVLASIAGVALHAGLALWFAWQLRGIAAGEPACPDPNAYVPGCEALSQRFRGLADWATGLLYLSWGAPFAMGLLLGVPIVSREIESGTAATAWTLSRSRIRWLLGRVAFAAAVLVMLLAVVTVVSGVLAVAIMPNLHLERDFTWIGRRDWLIVGRGLAALGLGVLIGAALGRLLPGLLAAAFASVVVFAGLSLAMDRWNETLTVVVDPSGLPDAAPESSGALHVGQRIELPSGELVSWSDTALVGDVQVIDERGRLYTAFDDETGMPDPTTFVGWDRALVVPGDRYPQVVARDCAVTIGVGLLALGGGMAVIRRRRPA